MYFINGQAQRMPKLSVLKQNMKNNKVDWAYCPLTEIAVKKYKKAEKLEVDGIFGKKSLAREKTVNK